MTQESPHARQRRRAIWVVAVAIVVGAISLGMLASGKAECSGGQRSVRLKYK